MVGGDFNTILDKDRDHKVISINNQATINTVRYPDLTVTEWIKNNKLIDYYRFINKNEDKFTHESINSIKDTLSMNRIDFILGSKSIKKKVISCDILDQKQINSDHKPVVIQLIMKIKQKNPKNEKVYNTRIFNDHTSGSKQEDFLKSLSDWIEINKDIINNLDTYNLDEFCSNLEKTINEITNKFYGLRKQRKSNRKQLDEVIINLIKYKKIGYKIWENIKKLRFKIMGVKQAKNNITKWVNKIPDDMWKEFNLEKNAIIKEVTDNPNLELFNKIKNKISTKTQNKLKVYENEKWRKLVDSIIEEAETNPSALFNFVKVKKNRDSIEGVIIEEDGEKVFSTKRKDIIKIFKDKWSEMFKTRKPSGLSSEWFSPHISELRGKELLVKPISIQEVKVFIRNMRNKKAPGLDNISAIILKSLKNIHTEFLTKLINTMFNTGYIPKEWKKGVIKLLYKDGSTTDPMNYRPITLLKLPYKILCGIMNSRLIQYLEMNNLISKQQSGFRNNRQTSDNIIALINVIEDAKKEGKEIHLTYLDFSKAYDSTEHICILQTAEHNQFPEKFQRIFESILKDNESCLNLPIHDGMTEFFKVERGVPQGNVISPTIFNMFINVLIEKIDKTCVGYKLNNNESIKILAYADDIVLITEDKQELENMINFVNKFCYETGMKINAKKCGYATNCKYPKIPKFNNEEVEFLGENKSYKYLGIQINLKLKWEDQYQTSINDYEKFCNRLTHFQIPTRHKIKLINAMANMTIGYRMRSILFPEEILEKCNVISRSTIRSQMNASTHTNNLSINSSEKMGGMGLVDLNTLQYSTIVSSYVTGVLNNLNSVANRIVITRLAKNRYKEMHYFFNLNEELNSNINTAELKKQSIFLYNLRYCLEKTGCYLKMNSINFDNPTRAFYNNTHIKQWFRDNKLQVSDILTPDKSKLIPRAEIKKKIITTSDFISFELEKQFKINSKQFKIGYKINYGTDIVPKIGNQEFNNAENWIEAYTDGSKTDKGAGIGVFFKKNHPLNFSGPCVGPFSVFNGELSAILYVLKNTPLESNIRIYTDSKSAIELINKIAFHIENNLRFKPNFNSRWVFNELIPIIRDKRDKKARIELKHIYSHSEKKEKNPNIMKKIQLQKFIYKEKFSEIVEGNKQADILAKNGSLQFKPLVLPNCTDKFFLISKETDGKKLVHQKIQNYLTQKRMIEQAKDNIESIAKRWMMRIDETSNTSWDLSINNWKQIRNLNFLIKLRGKDIKIKSNIEEKINHANQLITKNPRGNNSNTRKWLEYWNKSYQNDFTCDRCDKKCQENFLHFLVDCEKNEQRIIELQSKIAKLIKNKLKITWNSALPDNIPNFFSNIQHIDFKPFNKQLWKKEWGMMGIIPLEFEDYLTRIKIKNKKETLKEILLLIAETTYKIYLERCQITAEKLNLVKNYKSVFKNKKRKEQN